MALNSHRWTTIGVSVSLALATDSFEAQAQTGIQILPPPGSARSKRPSSGTKSTGKGSGTQFQGAGGQVGTDPNQPLIVQYVAPPNPSDYVGGYIEAAGGQLFAVPNPDLENFKMKSGNTAEAKAFMDITRKRYILDGGVGFFFYKVSGTEPILDGTGEQLKEKDGTGKTGSFGLSSYGTTIDLASSLRLRPNIFLGATLQLRRPSDLGYTSSVVRNETGILLGGQLGYELEGADVIRRVVVRATRGLNSIDWTDFHVYAGLQFGIPMVSLSKK